MTAKNKSLILGVGINDSDQPTRLRKNGKIIWTCKFYTAWTGMLRRCYYEKFKAKNPTYQDCTVCDEWLIFSNFKNWMMSQKWEGMSLDKDLILKGNKKYCPELCVFITKETNYFLTDRTHSTKNKFLGARPIKNSKKYAAQCRDGTRNVYLGIFDTKDEAHLAWKKFKHEVAIRLSEKQADPRASKALISRYSI